MTTKLRKRNKLVYGVGTNDADYPTSWIDEGKKKFCPYYLAWYNMLKRCYSAKYQNKQPTYRSCTVSDEWLVFSQFSAWMYKQDWVGKQLDKDILLPNNTIYSADYCVFVTSQLNKLIQAGKGYTYDKERRNYQANCGAADGSNKAIRLGRFDTEQEASAAYRQCKHDIILKVADEQDDVRIAYGLRLHAELLLEEKRV